MVLSSNWKRDLLMNCKKITCFLVGRAIIASLMFSLMGFALASSHPEPVLHIDYSLQRIISTAESNRTHQSIGVFDKAFLEPASNKKPIASSLAQDVFTEICRLGIREPQIVMRQALLETGRFQAPFLMKRNNLFGFRAQRYLSFSHWKDSVRYYSDWQNRHYKSSDANYFSFLTRKRYGAANYTHHLRKIDWNYSCSDVGVLSLSPVAVIARAN